MHNQVAPYEYISMDRCCFKSKFSGTRGVDCKGPKLTLL